MTHRDSTGLIVVACRSGGSAHTCMYTNHANTYTPILPQPWVLQNQCTHPHPPLTVVVSTIAIIAAICDPSVEPTPPAPVTAGIPVGQCPVMIIILLETLGLQFGRNSDGMITVNDNFSSFWKLTVIVELPFDSNFSFLQMLKWYQIRLGGENTH